MTKLTMAVVGATGAVGRAILAVLAERDLPVERVRLLASSRSAGTEVVTAWGPVVVEDLDRADPAGIDVALFSAGGARSREHAPRFVASGAVVVDNSSAFRMDSTVPLVVVDVNDHALAGHRGLIANPNCTTMVLAMAAAPLHRAAGLRSMVATSYQSVSGTGHRGIVELERQARTLADSTDQLVSGGWADPGSEVYPRPIAYNVLPFAGAAAEDGYTDEEMKLVNETRKILEVEDLAVEPTCVRVPVMTGHGVAASMWFDRPLPTGEAAELLTQAPGVELWQDKIPTPLDSAGIDEVLVGRLRQTIGRPGGISLWAVGDNLRKGAALNAVQIVERLFA